MKKSIVFIIILLSLVANGQSKKIVELEQQIYSLNNDLRYTESQDLINDFIKNKAASNEDLVYANILLSYTYKRLYDYSTTIAILNKTKKLAIESERPKELIGKINTQLAFSLFDVQKYDESFSLMKSLQNEGFKYNTTENKSKLLMQLGYIDYLNKNYTNSELMYSQSIKLMKKSSVCDLPIVYTKLMSLYYETNKKSALKKAFNTSLKYSDSCKIIKYSIYTYEEYYKILKKSNNINESFKVRKVLDSIYEIYKVEEKLGELHLEQQKQLVKETSEEKDKVKTRNYLLSVFLVIILIAVVFLFFSRKSRLKKQEALGFYEDKYNDLWANYQISVQQLEKLKQELGKNSAEHNADDNLNVLLKDISMHINTQSDNEHNHINILKNRFVKRLNKEAPYLNSQEQLVCFFLSLKLPHKKIGELLNKTEKSIESYKYRINSKIKAKSNKNIDSLIALVRSK